MNQINPSVQTRVSETEVVAGLKVVTTEYRVKAAVFEDEVVKRPVFVDEIIKVPVGYDKVINELALEISKSVIAITEQVLNKQIKMLEEKIEALSNIRTQEKLVIIDVPVDVEKPNYVTKDVIVERVVMIDKQVINPVLKDVEVINPIIIDKAVTNSVITDIRVTNAIIKDVEVERAVIREKVVEIIHKNCFDEKGNAL